MNACSRKRAQTTLSIFATKNEDRFGVTFEEFVEVGSVFIVPSISSHWAQILEVHGFYANPNLTGHMCPPRRFTTGCLGTVYCSV